MATATATFTVSPTAINASDNIQKSQIVRGAVTFSSATDTYAAGGLAATFASTSLEQIHTDLPPTYIKIWSQPAVGSPNTFYYIYTFNPGSTLANGKLQIWAGLGAAAEYTNSSAITNPAADTLFFEACLVRNL